MAKGGKIKRLLYRLFYTILNSKKADSFRELRTDELYDIYRKEKNVKDKIYYSNIRDSSWKDWFVSNRKHIIEIMERVDKNDQKKIIKRSDSMELSNSVDDDKDFLKYVDERAKRLKIQSKVPSMPNIPSALEHKLFFNWFNGNKERIIEMLRKTDSLPTITVHQHKYNKPTDEIRRIMARENWNAQVGFNKINTEFDEEREKQEKVIKNKTKEK